MVRNIFLVVACFISLQLMAQKPQKIGYIDMEYILENVPEYIEAQAKLEERAKHWQRKLDDIKREIEVLKTNLANEKALLTKELIQEREEDIEIKELDLRNLQATYFGPNGDIYFSRKQLVKPIQDQVYNAVQEIAVKKKYDMILDKSSDLIMLYTNKKYDESETVLNRIVKNRKVKALAEKRSQRAVVNTKLQEQIDTKAEQKKVRNEELQARILKQKEEKEKRRAELKKAAEEKRQKRIAEQERRKKQREARLKEKEKTNNN